VAAADEIDGPEGIVKDAVDIEANEDRLPAVTV
jgi:hypothetical protein